MSSLAIIVLLLCQLSRNTVLSRRGQRLSLNLTFSTNCCRFDSQYQTDDSSALLHCIQNSSHYIRPHNRTDSVAIVTFAAPGHDADPFSIADIWRYAAYQQAISAAYAEANGYLFKAVIDPLTGGRDNDSLDVDSTLSGSAAGDVAEALLSQYGTLDYRWYKVNLLQKALDPQIGWARAFQYVAWLGACCCATLRLPFFASASTPILLSLSQLESRLTLQLLLYRLLGSIVPVCRCRCNRTRLRFSY